VILEASGIDEADIRDAMRDEVDPGRWCMMDIPHLAAALGHHHETGGERDQPVRHPALFG